MRERFRIQLELGQTAIDKVKIPKKSRDELPPVLAGLQWIYSNEEISEQIFKLLEEKVIGEKKKTGRPGMDLWHILVLGVVRLALDCDYDRLEYLAHYDKLMREIMGLETLGNEEFGKGFHQKTIRDNVSHIDEKLLEKINKIIVKAGREEILKKNEKIEAKADTYVVETNVHYPTDINLLWDAIRKCITLLVGLSKAVGIVGWRKSEYWLREIKGLMRLCGRINKSGGKNKEKRRKKIIKEYLERAYQLEEKIHESVKELQQKELTVKQSLKIVEIKYFHDMLIKHIDLIDRRFIKEEKIPHEEKVFSLFESHTNWINKGKMFPSVELGLKVLVTTDQNGIVLDYKVLEENTGDNKETLELANRLINEYGKHLKSLSVDKGFSDQKDREILEEYIPEVIMPKKGRLNGTDKEREGQKRFKALKNRHSAIESNINSLEHHGLNRCPDKGLAGFKRYVGLGILAYNLHRIGKHILKKQQEELGITKEKLKAA